MKVWFGSYKCPKCFSEMLSLISDYEEIPLFCPACSKKAKYVGFIRNLGGSNALEELQEYLL